MISVRRLACLAALACAAAAIAGGLPDGGPAGPARTAANWGFGLAAGETAGVELSLRFPDSWEAAAVLGWDLTTPGGYTAVLDGRRRIDLAAPLVGRLGAGLRAAYLMGAGRYSGDPSRIGLFLRLPAGLAWVWPESSGEAWIEAAPSLRLAPSPAVDGLAAFGIETAIGWRWTF